MDDVYHKQRVYSPSSTYYFVHQFDGNIVLYRSVGARALWASNTTGGEGRAARLIMQEDGNFVLYWGERGVVELSGGPMAGLKPRWSTNTHGYPGAFLAVQDDGNLVMYTADKTRVLWATGTNGR